MTRYVGQNPREGITAIMPYEKEHPDLIFTETDRMQANQALANPASLKPEFFQRLLDQALDGQSIQAAYFTERLLPVVSLEALGIEIVN